MNRVDYEAECFELVSLCRLLCDYDSVEIRALYHVSQLLRKEVINDESEDILRCYEKYYKIQKKEMII
jgi:hypothetical protein